MIDEPQNTDNQEVQAESPQRLARYGASTRPESAHTEKYSNFIRRMRLILPLIAIAVIAVVFTYTSVREDHIITAQPSEQLPEKMGKNELLNPRFESRDEKNQPYTITAVRALQSGKDDDLVLLEKPLADMMLNSGNWVAAEAKKGAFRQDTQMLKLDGGVKIFHDKGYQLETAAMDIDLNASFAKSIDPVHVQGPAGVIMAKGLEGYGKKGHLIFNGPVALTLNRTTLNAPDQQENSDAE